jgi:hypothetical protein
LILGIGALLMIGAWYGCSASSLETPDSSDDCLIRIGNSIVTVADFNNAFETVEAAYPHNAIRDREVLKGARLRFLNQIIEETILLERARELKIEISDFEVEKTVSDIKKEYPEDVFDQILLQYAVSFHSWKEGLKARLLIEKVVTRELTEQLVITSEDISEYYQKLCEEDTSESDLKDESKDINEMIIKHLRREKTEEAYTKWIKELKNKYTIDINKDLWEKVMNS